MKPYLIILWALLPAFLHAQESHWKVDPRAFQYDMTVFAQVVYGSTPLTDYSNIEVAAFVGDECRGVLVPQSIDGHHYGYLRVRSNVSSGETINFRIFDKVTQQESVSSTSVPFVSLMRYGYPSSPMSILMGAVLLGDVDGDGAVTIGDITCLIDHLKGNTSPSFNFFSAEVKCDGIVNLTDVFALSRRLLRKAE